MWNTSVFSGSIFYSSNQYKILDMSIFEKYFEDQNLKSSSPICQLVLYSVSKANQQIFEALLAKVCKSIKVWCIKNCFINKKNIYVFEFKLQKTILPKYKTLQKFHQGEFSTLNFEKYILENSFSLDLAKKTKYEQEGLVFKNILKSTRNTFQIIKDSFEIINQDYIISIQAFQKQIKSIEEELIRTIAHRISLGKLYLEDDWWNGEEFLSKNCW